MIQNPKNKASEATELEKSYKLEDIVKQRQQTLERLALQPGEKVFDIGCGVGFLAHELALKVGETGKVVGIDQNPEMIRHSQQRCEGLPQIEFNEGDASQLPAEDQAFDAVSCTQVLLYVKDVSKVLTEMRRILKPGGRLVIV